MNISQAGVYAGPASQSDGADFHFTNHGSIAVLVALTPEAQAWVDDNVAADAVHWAGGVVIDKRLVAEVVENIAADGLTIGEGF